MVIKIASGNSVANLGPSSTYTYAIMNSFPILAISKTNSTVQLTWTGSASARYTIESTRSLSPGAWASVPPHTNLPGVTGFMTRSFPSVDATNEFYRIKVAQVCRVIPGSVGSLANVSA